MRRVLSTSGRPSSATAAASSGRLPTARRGNAEPGEAVLFDQPVLGRGQGCCRGRHRNTTRQRGQRLGRHVLEVAGDAIAGGQAIERGRIVVGRLDELAETGGTGIGLGIDDQEFETQRLTGLGQHPRQLAAAEYADLHAARGSGSSSTARVCAARQRR
jgi:hypothetical protein